MAMGIISSDMSPEEEVEHRREMDAWQVRVKAYLATEMAPLQALIDEVPLAIREPPSPELIYRRWLAEAEVRRKAKEEIAIRPSEVLANAEESIRIGIEHGWNGDSPQLTAARLEAEGPYRDRQAEDLADSRLPDWSKDEPPPLTSAQVALAERLRQSWPVREIQRGRHDGDATTKVTYRDEAERERAVFELMRAVDKG